MKVSNFIILLLLPSFFVLREIIKVSSSQILPCSYNKTILLDSKFFYSSLFACPSPISYFSSSLLVFLSFLSISLFFYLLEDKRISFLAIIFSFFFLVLDVLLYYYQSVSFLALLFLFPFFFLTFAF